MEESYEKKKQLKELTIKDNFMFGAEKAGTWETKSLLSESNGHGATAGSGGLC